MTKVEDVWSLLRAEVTARPSEPCPLEEAAGRVLREDVRALEDQPPFDRSAVDGFVVMASDTSARFEVAGELRAGDWRPGPIPTGAALRIATGGAVPCEGCEVVMVEDAAQEAGRVRFLRRGRDHIRRRGEDSRAGSVIVAAGAVVGSGVAGLLASVGCANPRVSKVPSLLHVATGNEIIAPEQTPVRGQVRDANSSLVRSWAVQRGITPRQARVAEDAAALAAVIAGSRDILLISGGASVGVHDTTAEVLREAGFDLLVTKVDVRPGKPLIVARRGDEWALGLPGNPLSHFVCLHVFGDALLAAMLGRGPQPEIRRGLAAGPCPANARETWWPAFEDVDAVHPLVWTSSGDLTSLARANALLRVPRDSGLAAGASAEFIRVE